jgi:tetratricopeptide (TPR) repeat protein
LIQVQLAKQFTNNVYNFKWNDNFSDARNFSLSKATKEWILVLDADESISPNDLTKIKNLLKNESNESVDAYVLNIRNYSNDLGKSGWVSSENDRYVESKSFQGYYAHKAIRLFRNKGYYFEGKIHETPYNSITSSNGKIFDSDIIMHHYGFANKNRELKKKESYILLLKERLEKKDFTEKKEDYILFELSSELAVLKKYGEAVIYLEKAVAIREDPLYLLNLGGLYIFMNNLEKAASALQKSIAMDSSNSSAHANLGIVYSKRGEYYKAIRKFKRAIELNPKSADNYYNLGLVYKKLKKEAEARKFFDNAIELNKNYDKIINSM